MNSPQEKRNPDAPEAILDAATRPPRGYSPLRSSSPARERASSDDATAYAAGFRAVTLYLLADAFDLHDTEAMWTGYHLDTVFAPLASILPHTVPLAVMQEVKDGTYSRQLELRERARLARGNVISDPNVLQAAPEEWAKVIIDQVQKCYRLRPIEESAMTGRLVGLLTELGVGDVENPRGATFLPMDLLLRMQEQDARTAPTR